MQQVESPVEKPVGIPVYNPVENTVKNTVKNIAAPGVAERTANMEQIYAPKLNKNRFRTLLTTAALAKLKARGESLQAAVEAQAAEDIAAVSEPVVVVKPIEEAEATETLTVAEEVGVLTEQIAMNETVVEKSMPSQVDEVSASVETVENPMAEVEKMVEYAEEPAVADQSVAEPAAKEDVDTETEVEAADNEVVFTAETQEDVAETEVGVSAPAEPDVPDVELKMVNANGVRLKMSAVQPARAAKASAPVEGCKKAGSFSMRFYVVKPGDQPMSIALKNNISLVSLLAANRITEGELTAGTVLRIPG